ncbi:FtsH protease regulator HflK [Planctomycetes bacterium Pla163]|uniref:FtsH protease regulator HflK n=1 Tax=Rohdeia mirabilis TaxID=2528008 RepID=A0A518CV47_9BACT|nr:FtsH protease regulator HflK [Planctomycetes bacterium Pla163]
MLFKTHISKNQIGLVFRRGDLARVLDPGNHTVLQRPFGRDELEVVDVLVTRFEHPLLDVLIEDAAILEQLEVVELLDHQRALVWKDGRLFEIVGPGRHAFWKRPYTLAVEVLDVSGAGALEHPRLDAILRHPTAPFFVHAVRVDANERVVFRRDGAQIGVRGPGLHAFWKSSAELKWTAIDLREQSLDVAGQEIMTKDRVTLRVNLLVTYRVVDVQSAVDVAADAGQALYRAAQLVLREAVGARELDDLLVDRNAVGSELEVELADRAAQLGLELTGLGVRDVILPGEMKTILNQVIEATKRAEANLIRRREETAAARSQANTAKLFESTPALRRMKELEALQEILKGTRATFVLGQDDVLGQLGRLIGAPPDEGDDP